MAVSYGWLLKLWREQAPDNEAQAATSAAVEAVTRDGRHRFAALDRTAVDEILAEQGEAPADDGVTGAVRVGKLLRADHLLLGSCIPGIGEGDLAVEMRLLSVRRGGEIEAARSGTCSACDSARLRGLVMKLTKELLSPLAGTDDTGGVLPGVP